MRQAISGKQGFGVFACGLRRTIQWIPVGNPLDEKYEFELFAPES
jgi:hypothetical protein